MNPKYLATTNEFTKPKMIKYGFELERIDKDHYGLKRFCYRLNLNEDIMITVYVTTYSDVKHEINVVIGRGLSGGEINWHVKTFKEFEDLVSYIIKYN